MQMMPIHQGIMNCYLINQLKVKSFTTKNVPEMIFIYAVV